MSEENNKKKYTENLSPLKDNKVTKKFKWRSWKATFPIAIIVFVLVFGINQFIFSNVDFICTRIVEKDGACANGAWSEWSTVSSETKPDGTIVNNEQRIYTGSKVTKFILQYINTRTNCIAGYIQTVKGDGGGASGFKSGTTTTVSNICQIKENRVVTERFNDMEIGVGVGVGSNITISNVTGTEIIIGAEERDIVSITGIAALTQFRRDNINLNISVIPDLIQSGNTAIVTWQTVDMTKCKVSADTNTDAWGLVDVNTGILGYGPQTAGEKTSSVITSRTVYTLDCIDFEGNQHTTEAVINVIPGFKEI